MTAWYPLHKSIHLQGVTSSEQNKRRGVGTSDANRQENTARYILERFHEQPGVVLADEVGMGKTFVALAVATSVTLADTRRRPVVVMVPSSLAEKWPRDLDYFKSRCLKSNVSKQVRCRSASNGVEFLKLLDDPLERRASIIFLTHGSMHRGLTDGWVKLAVIRQALFRKHNTQPIRRALSRCAGDLLRLKGIEKAAKLDQRGRNLWDRLLDAEPDRWLKILRDDFDIDPKGDNDRGTDDDPVPKDVIKVLPKLDKADLQAVYESLVSIPQRDSPTWKKRVSDTRIELNKPLKNAWKLCLTNLGYKLPLLVMDEAHHLKNAETNLAKLFHTADSEADAEEISADGALAGVFERMLFLTATPFQLGHHELCSVLDRFNGINWNSRRAPAVGRDRFPIQLDELRQKLDSAQHATQNLESAWGKLRPDDLVIDGKAVSNVEAWWEHLRDGGSATSRAESLVKCFDDAKQAMKAAEADLRLLVVRHLRDRTLKGKFDGVPRRERLPGAAVLNDVPSAREEGIELTGPSLVPFLLAARATTCCPDDRPLFAEGLASSYEAFRNTRKPNKETRKTGTGFGTDADDETSKPVAGESSALPNDNPKAKSDREAAEWYLSQLERLLPSASHPKVAATVQRVLKAWREHEKVLVFCHFIATGQTLNEAISAALNQEVERLAAEKMGCSEQEAAERLMKFGNQFRRADADSPARRAVNDQVEKLLKNFPHLQSQRDDLQRVCRRFVRTPSFLVRYFPMRKEKLDVEAIQEAFDASKSSGLSLTVTLSEFFNFLSNDCDEALRKNYLEAVLGTHRIASRAASSSKKPTSENNASQAELHSPNVRLVNGATDSETRQRLMLTFNSPFFPEVLIASSVMAEGVDLHRFCRYVIHHDLSWNPSTLEQRTGRIDRIGAKVEQCGEPVRIYLPYLGETQDEKQYRVVMDRERWFSVVMGEKFRTDARSTDRLAERVPFPEALARQLAFRLEANETDTLPTIPTTASHADFSCRS